MKYILLALSLILISCGNPHISSSRGGLERSNPPLTLKEEAPKCPAVGHEGIEFFIDKEAEITHCTDLHTEVLASNDKGGPTAKDSKIWTYAEGLDWWAVRIDEELPPSQIKLMDCDGTLVEDIELARGTTQVAFIGHGKVCEVRLEIDN